MDNVKKIEIKRIDSKSANNFIRTYHYSGKVVVNSQLHFGAFLGGKLHGVMSLGPSLDKGKMMGMVKGTGWNEFVELNRMAFDGYMPRNSESRAISVAIRLIRKHAPQIKWIVSFADATQCGDGTIYRASGFDLTGIKINENSAVRPDGVVEHKMKYESNPVSTGYTKINHGKNDWRHFCEVKGWKTLKGFQLRYIKFLDESYRGKLTVPILPYSKIDEMNAGMYKGEKVTVLNRHHGKDKQTTK